MKSLLESKQRKSLSVTHLLLMFARKHKSATSILIFAGVFWAVTFPAVPYLLGHIIDQIKAAGDPQNVLFSLIAFPVIAFISINFLRTLNYFMIGYVFSILLPILKKDTIEDMLSYIGMQSYRYFESRHSGFLTNKITNAINSIEPVIQSILTIIFPRILALIIAGAIMATVSPIFMLITWVWAMGLILYTYQSAKVGRNLSQQLAHTNSVANGKIVDYVSNITQVIFSSTQQKESQLIQPTLVDMTEKDGIMQYNISKVRLIQGLMTTVFMIFTMAGLIYGYDQKWVSAGDFAFIFTLLFFMFSQVHDLGVNILDFYKNTGRLQEGLSLLHDEFEVVDTPQAKPHVITQGDISIERLSFQYDKNNKLFDDLSLKILPGEKVGIVGRSGAGKTTLIKLLMRLYDIQSGIIKIDGVDIKDYTIASLRRQLSLVPQEPSLFHRTIFENINYGCEKTTKEDVIEAAKKAHCHDFIMQLPEKYQTQVGERGIKLSGGQRQRIAIARALLKNAPILLLDEATSALDSETEAKIQESLDCLMQNKTAVVVAHRLSTLKTMNRIVVLDAANIAEAGSHAELLEHKSIYHKLWEHQSGGFLID